MISAAAHRALLERLLRMEAAARGWDVDPPEVRPVVLPTRPRRHIQRKTTPDDRAAMRKLRRDGLTCSQIARRVGFSESTVKMYTKGIEKGKQDEQL